jgi:hypothetical protein
MPSLDLPKVMEKSNANMKWVFNNQKSLIDQYQNEYITIDNESFIDHDKNFKQLLDKLKKNRRYTDSTFIQFIPDKDMKLM